MQYGGQNGGFGQQGDREKQRYVMMDARKSYTNTWATDLMSAPCTNPGFCLYAACWCVSILPPRDLVRTRDVSARAPDPAPRPAPDPRTSPPRAFFKTPSPHALLDYSSPLLSSPLTPPLPIPISPPPLSPQQRVRSIQPAQGAHVQ